MILSIGTGAAPGQAVTGDPISSANRLEEIVMDLQQTNGDCRMDHNDMIRHAGYFGAIVYKDWRTLPRKSTMRSTDAQLTRIGPSMIQMFSVQSWQAKEDGDEDDVETCYQGDGTGRASRSGR